MYSGNTGRLILTHPKKTQLEAINASVSHIVSANPETYVPGYSVEKTFGAMRILRRDANRPAVRRWQNYALTEDGGPFVKVARQLYPERPAPPPNWGIRFADEVSEQ